MGDKQVEADSAEKCRQTQMSWLELRGEGLLTDCVLTTEDGVEIPAHSLPILLHAPALAQLLLRPGSDGQCGEDVPPVRLHLPMDEKCVMSFLSFCYTGEVSCEGEGLGVCRQVVALLALARKLACLDLELACVKVLSTDLVRKDTALQILCFGYKLNLDSVISAALHCSAIHFSELSGGCEVLRLPVKGLRDLITSDYLHPASEDEVYHTILRWVRHDEDRSQHLDALLMTLRLGRLSVQVITDSVLQCVPTTSHPHYLQRVAQFRRYQWNMEQQQAAPADQWMAFHRPRIPTSILLVIGGWSDGSPTSSTECLDMCAGQWYQLSHPATRYRAYHGSMVIGHHIYIVGGFDGVEQFNTCSRYDLLTFEVERLSPMYHSRCYVAACELGGSIYACGGYDGRERLAAAESYDPRLNQWTKLANMGRKRSDAACVAYNGKVWVIGGFNGQQITHTVEIYDPHTNTWSPGKPLHLGPRSGVNACVYRGQVYVMGGFDGQSRLRTVERYNEGREAWEPVASMITTRSNFGSGVINDKLVVVGGFNGVTTIPHVEYFDGREWSVMQEMGVNRSALSVCTASIENIGNIREFTCHGMNSEHHA